MPEIKDLTPYPQSPIVGSRSIRPAGRALAIGWLSTDTRFPIGRVPQRALSHLEHILKEGIFFMQTRGIHRCELCDGAPIVTIGIEGRELTLGSAQLGIVGGDTFIAPDLVYHYIQAHKYRPPRSFIDALLADNYLDNVLRPKSRGEELRSGIRRTWFERGLLVDNLIGTPGKTVYSREGTKKRQVDYQLLISEMVLWANETDNQKAVKQAVGRVRELLSGNRSAVALEDAIAAAGQPWLT